MPPSPETSSRSDGLLGGTWRAVLRLGARLFGRGAPDRGRVTVVATPEAPAEDASIADTPTMRMPVADAPTVRMGVAEVPAERPDAEVPAIRDHVAAEAVREAVAEVSTGTEAHPEPLARVEPVAVPQEDSPAPSSAPAVRERAPRAAGPRDAATGDDFAAALREVEELFDRTWYCSLGGEPARSGTVRELRSPRDTRRIVGRLELAAEAEAVRAVELAGAAFPAWAARDASDRIALVSDAARRLQARGPLLAALLCHELGMTPAQALGEVNRAADLLRLHCEQMPLSLGERAPFAPSNGRRATNVMRPYGAWGVLTDYGSPVTEPAGMLAAALMTGNTVVFSPAREASSSGAMLDELFWDAGVPRDVLHLVLADDGAVGVAVARHPRTQGLAFAGRHDTGMRLHHGFSTSYPRPTVLELGGKSPAIVLADADLDRAAAGVAGAAFAFAGQRRDACARVYVAHEAYDAFAERLVSLARGLVLGDPLAAGVAVGPLVDARAVARFEECVREVGEAGGEILVGGGVARDGELAHGHYVEPTIAMLPDPGHRHFFEELRLPLLLVHAVRGLDEAVTLSNATRYGLAAALYGGTPAEIDRFAARVEAGAVFVDPEHGATTGSEPGVGAPGWKASGGGGIGAQGHRYLLRYAREQARSLPTSLG